MGQDQQDHDPTGLSGLGDHSHSIWDGFNPRHALGERLDRGYFMLLDPSAPQECHRVLFRSSCPSQQLWLHPCHGNQHQALPCRSHLQLWPEVLMRKSSLGRCTKAKIPRDIHGNIGNPALQLPAGCLSSPWCALASPTAGNHQCGTQCGYPALCQAATGRLCGGALTHLSAASCLPSHQATALLLPNEK